MGAWYREGDSFIVTLGMDTKVLRIGYSYDLTTSQLGAYSGGSHELSVALKVYCAQRKRRLELCLVHLSNLIYRH